MPSLYTPLPNRSVPYDVAFQWAPALDAEGYNIQIADNEEFAAPLLVDQAVSRTFFRADLPVIGPVWWRVRPVYADGSTGPWSRVRRLEILAPPLAASIAAVTLTPASIAGGAEAVGLVTLAEPAPIGGATVRLSSSDPRVTVPPRILIPSWVRRAAFKIATKPVDRTADVTISAASRGEPRTAALTLGLPRPPVRLHSLRVNPSVLVAGGRAVGTVALAGLAEKATTICLASDDKRVALPEIVTIPAGSRAASFPVLTAHDNSPAKIVITAASGSETQSTTLDLTGAGSMNALAAPEMTLPPAQAVASRQLPIEFAWSDVMGAASYTLEVDDTPAFDSPLVRTVPGPRVMIHPLPPGPVWWRVRANDQYRAPGQWSETRVLRVR